MIVLGSLVVGMTLTSLFLLVLMPGPVAPLQGLTLSGVDRTIDPVQRLFDIPEPRDWQAIVIHDSRTPEGSAQSISRMHEQLGKDGLGYHFVINNGTGKPDGTIEIGFRWQRQYPGAYLDSADSQWFNEYAIGICLIGAGEAGQFTDAQIEELVWLTRQLQERFSIARHEVYVQVGGSGPGQTLFPEARFRNQLLSLATH